MEEVPEELKDLAYTDDPRVRRLLIREAQRRLGKTLGELVDVVFDDCTTEEEFEARAEKWREAFNPDWTAEDLKRWAMKRRGLIS